MYIEKGMPEVVIHGNDITMKDRDIHRLRRFVKEYKSDTILDYMSTKMFWGEYPSLDVLYDEIQQGVDISLILIGSCPLKEKYKILAHGYRAAKRENLPIFIYAKKDALNHIEEQMNENEEMINEDIFTEFYDFLRNHAIEFKTIDDVWNDFKTKYKRMERYLIETLERIKPINSKIKLRKRDFGIF
jgi:hypothetical protein